MAKTKVTKTEVAVKETVKTGNVISLKSLKRSDVFTLIRPRVTEKATFQSEKNVYVFEVQSEASKQEIAKAIKTAYKVTPVMVRTTKIMPKTVFSRGKWGTKSGGKKAYVYLKEGDKIEIV